MLPYAGFFPYKGENLIQESHKPSCKVKGHKPEIIITVFDQNADKIFAKSVYAGFICTSGLKIRRRKRGRKRRYNGHFYPLVSDP